MAMSYAIAHIGINVLDLDHSVKFYEDVFGMKEVFRMHPKSALDMVIAEASTPAVDGCARPAARRPRGADGGRCRNLSFLSSTTLNPKRARLCLSKKPMRKCKKNRAVGELEGARPASNEILRSLSPKPETGFGDKLSAAVRMDCRACHARAGHGTMKPSIIPEGRAPVCRGRNGP